MAPRSRTVLAVAGAIFAASLPLACQALPGVVIRDDDDAADGVAVGVDAPTSPGDARADGGGRVDAGVDASIDAADGGVEPILDSGIAPFD